MQGHGHWRTMQLPRRIHAAARREDVQRSAQSRGHMPASTPWPSAGQVEQGLAGSVGVGPGSSTVTCMSVGEPEKREAQHQHPLPGFHHTSPGSRASKRGSHIKVLGHTLGGRCLYRGSSWPPDSCGSPGQ